MLRWLVGCKGAQESASGHEGCRWVQRTRIATSLPPANEVWGKVMFYTCVSLCSQGESLCPSMHHRSHDREGLCPGGLCPGRSLTRGVSVWGGALSRGRSLSGGGLSGRPRTETPPCMVRILMECILVFQSSYKINICCESFKQID